MRFSDEHFGHRNKKYCPLFLKKHPMYCHRTVVIFGACVCVDVLVRHCVIYEDIRKQIQANCLLSKG